MADPFADMMDRLEARLDRLYTVLRGCPPEGIYTTQIEIKALEARMRELMDRHA